MDYQTLGKRIAELRQERGISQQTMANDLDLSRATINALENARPGDIGVRKVIKILDYLGMELAIRERSPFPTLEELRDGK